MYTKEEAQAVLDKNNGNFQIIKFKNVREHALVQCRKCGYTWEVSIFSLYHVKSESKGCPGCTKKKIEEMLFNKGFKILEHIRNNLYKFQCLKCGEVFVTSESSVMKGKYHCQGCKRYYYKQLKEIDPKDISSSKELGDTRKYKLKRLLSDELQTYYILGFIFADGHIGNKKRLKICLSDIDYPLLVQISDYLNVNSPTIHDSYCELNIQDTYSLQKLSDQYCIDSNKTIYPCYIQNIDGDKLTAFMIGFIDGDGYIGYRSDNNGLKISLKLYKSWEENLNYMVKHLYKCINKNKSPRCVLVKKEGE